MKSKIETWLKKAPPAAAAVCGLLMPYAWPFVYLFSRDIVLHEDPENDQEAKRFARSNLLLSLTLFLSPVAMYRITKRLQEHYIDTHDALRGDPESNETDVYTGVLIFPAARDLVAKRYFARIVPKRDFWGGRPWLAYTGFLPFALPIMFSSFCHEVQLSLQRHRDYHERLTMRAGAPA